MGQSTNKGPTTIISLIIRARNTHTHTHTHITNLPLHNTISRVNYYYFVIYSISSIYGNNPMEIDKKLQILQPNCQAK